MPLAHSDWWLFAFLGEKTVVAKFSSLSLTVDGLPKWLANFDFTTVQLL